MLFTILIILIAISLIINYYPSKEKSNFNEICKGNIALVGNGPISDEQRNIINSSDCIIRINNSRNKLPHERTDILVLRDNVIHLSDKDTILWPVIPWCKNLKDYKVSYSKLIKPIKIYDEVHCPDKKNDPNIKYWKSNKVFKECIKDNKHGDSYSGISTGTAVISELMKNDAIVKLDVFGMNFNGHPRHLDFVDKEVTDKCCTKCIFHKTPVQEY